MPKLWGYIRVSTRDQAESGLGLDSYRETVRKAFETRFQAEGYELAEIVEDRAVSGKRPLRSRPEGCRMNLALEKGDCVVFPKLCRGFRNTADMLNTTETWKARGVRVVFLDMLQIDTDTPGGRMMLTMWAAFHQLEREMISERTKAGLDQARKRAAAAGRPFIRSKAPALGLKLSGSKGRRWYEVIPDIYLVGLKVVEWQDKGFSLEQIMWKLRDAGIRRIRRPGEIRGRNWSKTCLWRLYRATVKIGQMLKDGQAHLPQSMREKKCASSSSASSEAPPGSTGGSSVGAGPSDSSSATSTTPG